MKVTKTVLPVFVDEHDEPIGIIYNNKHRNREIFMLTKASEDDIIELLECKEKKL